VGWQDHVVLTAIAYALLQRERMRSSPVPLACPGIRAIVQETLTALMLDQQPIHLKRIQDPQQINLRI
jgi:hypothetical protein